MRSETPNESLCAAGLCLILILAACAAADVNVFRVATTDEEEAFPAVSGNTVVWQFYNSRYDDWDIRAADISDITSPVDFPIADVPGDDVYPSIDGNDVVWQHHIRVKSDGDVYTARIANHSTLSMYAVSATTDDERLPCVSEGVVVWQHKFYGVPDWDILGARLTGDANPEPIHVATSIDIDEMAPCISKNLVVWHEESADAPPWVRGADISDPNNPRSFYTTMALGSMEIPSLSEGRLVARETDGVGKVMVDNLFDPFNPEPISSSGRTACPRIHKHIVVWQDQSNGTWDIRGYNLLTRQEFVVTSMKMSDQINPAVYVDTQQQRAVIVWQDDRDGTWDIYAAIVNGPEVATQTDGQ